MYTFVHIVHICMYIYIYTDIHHINRCLSRFLGYRTLAKAPETLRSPTFEATGSGAAVTAHCSVAVALVVVVPDELTEWHLEGGKTTVLVGFSGS